MRGFHDALRLLQIQVFVRNNSFPVRRILDRQRGFARIGASTSTDHNLAWELRIVFEKCLFAF